MTLFPLLDEFPLRVEEVVTEIVCAASLRDDHHRQPSFYTMCGRTAKWPGHVEAEQAQPVTCLMCWQRVLPKDAP